MQGFLASIKTFDLNDATKNHTCFSILHVTIRTRCIVKSRVDIRKAEAKDLLTILSDKFGRMI